MRHLSLAPVSAPACALLVWFCSGLPGAARADVDLKFSGSISADIRYRLNGPVRDPPVPSQWQLLQYGFSRNENRIRAALNLSIGQKVKAVADTELVTYGFSDLKDFDSTTLRERVDPYFFEFHAAYIDINNLLPHVDLRIGRQVVPWGAADKFNPVSNLNTLDLSDPLLFGRALANNMVKLDWNPVGDLTFTVVAVPIFRPAQLPRSAPLALLDATRPAPVTNDQVRLAIDDDRDLQRAAGLNITVDANPIAPEISLRNTQFAARAASKLFGQDVAVSYYHGFFGVPVPAWSVVGGANIFSPPGTPRNAVAHVGLVYPRMDVVGLEAAGSIERLRGIGWWAEAAVIIPQEVGFAVYEDIGRGFQAREYVNCGVAVRPLECGGQTSGYIGASRPVGTRTSRPDVVESTPFVKATLGADYTFGGHVYLNLQYVHGFIDEFGAGRAARPRANPDDPKTRVEAIVGDYLVGGMDIKTLSDRLVFRLFAVLKLPSVDLTTGLFDDYAPTGVLFPQIIWAVWDATELTLGSFVMLGDRSTKFGDLAAGGTEVFLKGKVSF